MHPSPKLTIERVSNFFGVSQKNSWEKATLTVLRTSALIVVAWVAWRRASVNVVLSALSVQVGKAPRGGERAGE
jgi:hypothetical protein